MRWLFPHPALAVMLAVIWLFLRNEITPGGVVFALLVGVTVPVLTRRFWPERTRIRIGLRLVAFLAVVVWDIVIANFEMAWLVMFRRSRDLRSHWLVVPLDLEGADAIAMLTATLCLAPGTVASDLSADGRALLVHAIDVADPEAEVARIKARYEAPLRRIFA
ncbi:Na+/H+ antiporter subunit E [Chondromyces apiculatus]|uniref:Na(+) H(+) antiporter subunit E n=1 Tax=Chondromyces apiculatus DSM 436 TaxID=1192034 RepID=A0A017SZX8_9BACT|nr:Na+/H+ antiporter subunit E [Chondromyces apiculatus]EYF01871.1 Na(+) H(+) antiporter subunit E [Chondromyces apiculatus DSM 436]